MPRKKVIETSEERAYRLAKDSVSRAKLKLSRRIAFSGRMLKELPANLADAPLIEEVRISFAGISDISILAKLPNLKSLIIWRTPVLEFGPLSRCRKLETLRLEDVLIDNLAPIARTKVTMPGGNEV